MQCRTRRRTRVMGVARCRALAYNDVGVMPAWYHTPGAKRCPETDAPRRTAFAGAVSARFLTGGFCTVSARFLHGFCRLWACSGPPASRSRRA
eukprot:3205248-Rhodomonas_salina.1